MLEKLDETRRQAYFNTLAIQNRRKNYYDSKLISKNLQPNDLVLLFDSPTTLACELGAASL